MRLLHSLPLLVACLAITACEKQSEAPASTEAEAETLPQAPDFTHATMSGETFTLSEQRGKIVVLDFWATWCKPCVAAMPHLQQLHEDYRDRGVIVTGVNLMEGPDADPAGFVEDQGFTYQQLLDADDVGQLFGVVQSIPVFIIIGTEGEIIYRQTGFHPDEVPEIRRVIDEELAEQGG